MGAYKSAHAPRRTWPRWIVAVGIAFATGALVYAGVVGPPPESASSVAAAGDGVRVVNGVPVGFPATARGAGDAAARFEAVLSGAGSLPRQEAIELLRRLYPEVTDDDVVQLLPTLPRDRTTGVWQNTTVRVWAERARDPTVLGVGSTVRVQTLVLSLFGPTTDGVSGVGEGGLAGMWTVHDVTMRWTDAGWRLAGAQTPIPVPPPDVAGTVRDGSPRDGQVFARVLGPDSWGP